MHALRRYLTPPPSSAGMSIGGVAGPHQTWCRQRALRHPRCSCRLRAILPRYPPTARRQSSPAALCPGTDLFSYLIEPQLGLAKQDALVPKWRQSTIVRRDSRGESGRRVTQGPTWRARLLFAACSERPHPSGRNAEDPSGRVRGQFYNTAVNSDEIHQWR
ncbi:hypothetical protein OH77DRAFT_390426 [Trametes cingulata]|nr:hypothetical protein OH77DRAFT_390426 [Trametes cingulata]